MVRGSTGPDLVIRDRAPEEGADRGDEADQQRSSSGATSSSAARRVVMRYARATTATRLCRLKRPRLSGSPTR